MAWVMCGWNLQAGRSLPMHFKTSFSWLQALCAVIKTQLVALDPGWWSSLSIGDVWASKMLVLFLVSLAGAKINAESIVQVWLLDDHVFLVWLFLVWLFQCDFRCLWRRQSVHWSLSSSLSCWLQDVFCLLLIGYGSKISLFDRMNKMMATTSL